MWLKRGVGVVEGGGKVAMVASAVSSKMLKAIAEREGFRFEETLTGFKWIGSRMVELRGEGYDACFGYEEAIGFACGDVVSDKDGISAAAVFAEMAAYVYAEMNMDLKVRWGDGARS